MGVLLAFLLGVEKAGYVDVLHGIVSAFLICEAGFRWLRNLASLDTDALLSVSIVFVVSFFGVRVGMNVVYSTVMEQT